MRFSIFESICSLLELGSENFGEFGVFLSWDVLILCIRGMACLQDHRRTTLQGGYYDTRISFQGGYHDPRPSLQERYQSVQSSSFNGGVTATRNYSSVHDLTRKFRDFGNENGQVGVPPAFKRHKNCANENSSAENHQFNSRTGDFPRGQRLRTDAVGSSAAVMATNDGHRCVPPSTSYRFIDLGGAEDSNARFCSFGYDTISSSDTVLTVENCCEPSEGFMSREELERCSPSRKDGIDSNRETYLRYSYCSFLQNLGLRLELPQTTIGTAIILCHRFFVHRSHACHDRFLIATASLFLAAKSEETPCPLNTVLKAAFEICHKQGLSLPPYLLSLDWFEEYRERVIGAEHIILTTLDFELGVQHPYGPLTSVLNKLGLTKSVLLNLALDLVNEGLLGGRRQPIFNVLHCPSAVQCWLDNLCCTCY
ncbi:uncharacterized protein LOC116248843 isoform X2 [Nymphaea colorata]|uniref:uncharacterized protein LOC116248843 isoform X2 n=1 Tax=Nymphaea colorata TaxID=210225 RepID=UPI00129DA450|nr:uncharacterized protein LOC116248843 isoform X2 [Nymphaea colorata]